MKLFLALTLVGYWALTVSLPVPIMQEGMQMPMMDDMHNDSTDPHMMQMFFTVSEHCTILFEEWHTMNYGELVGSAIALAVLAALYEGFKVMREELLMKMTSGTGSQVTLTGSTTKVGSSQQGMIMVESNSRRSPLTLLSSAHILQALLHFVQVWISYLLMLAFMTYNVVVCMFIAFGAAVGYWVFAWKRSQIQDANEHCH